jgi:hypothetical protein
MTNHARTPLIVEGYVYPKVLDMIRQKCTLNVPARLIFYPFKLRGTIRAVAEIRTDEELNADA